MNRPFPKLAIKYFGPYKILAKVGESAYKLELPAESQIHPVFPVSRLKEFTADFSPVFSTLPSLPQLDVDNLEPEEVLNR